MNAKTINTQVQISVYPILNLHCAGCAQRVEKIASLEQGVEKAQVNFAASTLQLHYRDPLFRIENLASKIKEAGYELITEEKNAFVLQEEKRKSNFKKLSFRVIGSWCLAIPLGFLGMTHGWEFVGKNELMMGLSLIVMVAFGQQFYINAWKRTLKGSADMDTLVALSTSVSFLFSVFNTFGAHFWEEKGLHAHVYYEASGMIIAFVLLGKWLEEKSKHSTSASLRALMNLQPAMACRRLPSGQEQVPVAYLQKGDRVIIKPGEKIPVDGFIEAGASSVEESTISGESLPVYKRVGDLVWAGTLNKQGALDVKVSDRGEGTRLSQMIRAVREAQGSKAPIQRTVDKVASIFVPVVLGISLLTFVLWWFFGGERFFFEAMNAAVSVLVIACPCALGLATPTALMVGMGKAAEDHILVKDATAMEELCRIDTVVMDKTGTLTQGHPTVIEVWSENERFSTPFVLKVLKESEQRSEHPVAEALADWAEKRLGNRTLKEIEMIDFESVQGRGIRFYVQEEGIKTLYWVGSVHWARDLAWVSEAATKQMAQWESKGYSWSVMGREDEILGLLAVADPIRTQAAALVQQLQELGLEVHMLTGDQSGIASSVAADLGIKYYKANVLPEEKENYVRALQDLGRKVAMVGDGVNDSRALAVAHVSVAMGNGTDVAMQVAMVTLLQNRIELLPKAILWSKRTVKCIRENLFWAFLYNLMAIPIAAGLLYPWNGFMLSPMIASAAMALSSVSVVAHSLQMKYRK